MSGEGFLGVLIFLIPILGILSSPPNIVVILADDLGWADVGWNNPGIHTPTLDRMAREGVILNQSYVQSTCSPSRAAFMSGRYPYHMGMQHRVIMAGWKQYLPDDQPILPEVLHKMGYATHMVGKWHLGYCAWRYTPTYRGFQSFYGFYNALEDYYNHTGQQEAYDFRDNDQVDRTAVGHYSTHLFANRATRIINEHDVTQPLFLYLSFQSVHGPLQVPQWYVDTYCSHVPASDSKRRLKCGMIAAMDEAVANVTDVLHRRGLLNNTFLLFFSDNGGPVNMGGSNWPLRGSKTTLWEGGTRSPSFVSAPGLLHRTGYTYQEMIHVSDWFPTLVEAAADGNDTARDIPTNIDGVSQWRNLLAGSSPGPRTEFVYNFDDLFNNSAIRQGPYKLVHHHPGNPDGWFAPSEMKNATTVNLTSPTGHPEYLLFNVLQDPLEKTDVKDVEQDVFQRLKARMVQYRQSMVPAVFPGYTEASTPSKYFNNVWSPGWC
ncbi:arylsulfatase B-like [Littorina saxatilis]|uniref:Sulfatase N-terminal domain-containing protein n=1 Tax=Littorina saxatilis TaxID=31220 RepID=A0AAN9BDK3_9CAEN